MGAKLLPHIGLERGSVSPDVIVCGDPARATRIAEQLDGVVLLGEKREYRTYQGQFMGLTVTVTSHGIGAPGAAIAFEELISAGAQRIVRVGTCGGLQPTFQAGDLVVATAAVDLTENGRSVHNGIVLTSDVFYDGIQPSLPVYETMSQANIMAVEMECAALFIIGSLRGVPTGAILAVDGNVLDEVETVDTFNPDQMVVKTAVHDAISITLHALASHAQKVKNV